MISSCYVSDLFTYPVKSLQGNRSDALCIDDFGFEYDRRFMLVDDNNKFITQRTHPRLANLSANLNRSPKGDLLSIDILSADLGCLTFSFEMIEDCVEQQKDVIVWKDSTKAIVINNHYTEMLSNYLGINTRLAYMPDSTFRQVDRQFFSEDKRVSFSDGFPFLLVSEVSLADLNSRLNHPVSMRNFRPNIIVSGGISAYAEDLWQRITIGDVTFELVKPCSRCIMTTVNEKGEMSQDKEPLKTLSKYRRNEFGICFGQNLVHLSKGQIRVGDIVSFT